MYSCAVFAHSMIFWIISLNFLFYNCGPGPSEYDYADVDLKSIRGGLGTRLVGARAGDHSSEAPFLVAINTLGGSWSSCTGMLITPTYVLSAAHCTEYIPMTNREKDNEKCIQLTNSGHTFLTSEYTLKCRKITTKEKKTKNMIQNLEIVPISPKGKVWLGVDNMNDKLSIKLDGESSSIKRVIRHAYSYKGGGDYGSFGGYDIAIIQLDKSLDRFQQACLPSPKFNDTDKGKLAGYGKYFRGDGRICQTNRYGKMKFHYCKSRTGTNCHSDRPPPTPKACGEFFSHLETPTDVPDDKEEIMITEGTTNTFCFRKENKENKDYGWCYTEGDYYDPKHPDQSREGWGFCSRDCYLDKKEERAGVLRIVDHVEVLPENICAKFLTRSLSYKTVKHRPLILCVGKINHWSTDVWEREEGGKKKYQNIKSEKAVKMVNKYHFGEHLGFGGYVASAGTCSGDSGGPMYQEQVDWVSGKTRYIVTGIVSGGRGNLGSCGGINNPVHYVRLRSFVKWIIQVIGKLDAKKICWDNSFEKRKIKRLKQRKG